MIVDGVFQSGAQSGLDGDMIIFLIGRERVIGALDMREIHAARDIEQHAIEGVADPPSQRALHVGPAGDGVAGEEVGVVGDAVRAVDVADDAQYDWTDAPIVTRMNAADQTGSMAFRLGQQNVGGREQRLRAISEPRPSDLAARVEAVEQEEARRRGDRKSDVPRRQIGRAGRPGEQSGDGNEKELSGIARGAAIVAIADPFKHEKELAALAQTGATLFAMEFMPRITRAQVMDVLSSQANIAGYRAVIDAAAEYSRAIPMMMTAAGTVPAAKIFIMGVGVAGLQAIATARRLGGIVSATDVRPATKEQVESLGAKFIAVENDEFRQAETSGGYAKEMSPEYQAAQAELVAAHIAKQDIVVTTALIPGRPAPVLISAAAARSMRAGSVIIDLAAERGGNCELTKPGETIVDNGVKIVGAVNLAGRLPATASGLYAKNLLAFVETLISKETKTLAIDWNDELVKATALTRDGAVIDSRFAA